MERLTSSSLAHRSLPPTYSYMERLTSNLLAHGAAYLQLTYAWSSVPPTYSHMEHLTSSSLALSINIASTRFWILMCEAKAASLPIRNIFLSLKNKSTFRSRRHKEMSSVSALVHEPKCGGWRGLCQWIPVWSLTTRSAPYFYWKLNCRE